MSKECEEMLQKIVVRYSRWGNCPKSPPYQTVCISPSANSKRGRDCCSKKSDAAIFLICIPTILGLS